MTFKAAAILFRAIPTYGILPYTMIYSMTILPSGENCFVLPICSLLPTFASVCCLQYANFVLQAKNAVNKAINRRMCVNL